MTEPLPPADQAAGTAEVRPEASDGWQWRYLDEAGVEAAGPGVAFDSQESAEAWLTDHYPELADDGITAVILFDGEHTVYGPMPLDPID